MTAQASYDESFRFEIRALEERNTPVSAFPGNQFLTDVTSNPGAMAKPQQNRSIVDVLYERITCW